MRRERAGHGLKNETAIPIHDTVHSSTPSIALRLEEEVDLCDVCVCVCGHVLVEKGLSVDPWKAVMLHGLKDLE